MRYWLEFVAVVLFVGYFLYLGLLRQLLVVRRGRRELPSLSDLGFTFVPSFSRLEVGTLEGRVRGYPVRITPDDDQVRIHIQLESDPRLELLIGDGRYGPGFPSKFRSAGRLLADAIRKRAEEHGLVDDPSATSVLRAFLEENRRVLAAFYLSGSSMGCAPREGTTRNYNWVRSRDVRKLLPDLLDVAEALDAACWLPSAPKVEATAQGYRKPGGVAEPAFSADQPLLHHSEVLRRLARARAGEVSMDEYGVSARGNHRGREWRVLMAEGGCVEVSVEPAELPRFQLYHDTGKARPGMLALAEHFYLDGPEAGECAKWLDEPKRQAIFAFSRNCQVFLVDSLERRLRVELSVPAGNVDSDALDRLLSDLDRCLDCLEQTGSDSRAAIRSE